MIGSLFTPKYPLRQHFPFGHVQACPKRELHNDAWEKRDCAGERKEPDIYIRKLSAGKNTPQYNRSPTAGATSLAELIPAPIRKMEEQRDTDTTHSCVHGMLSPQHHEVDKCGHTDLYIRQSQPGKDTQEVSKSRDHTTQRGESAQEVIKCQGVEIPPNSRMERTPSRSANLGEDRLPNSRVTRPSRRPRKSSS